MNGAATAPTQHTAQAGGKQALSKRPLLTLAVGNPHERERWALQRYSRARKPSAAGRAMQLDRREQDGRPR